VERGWRQVRDHTGRGEARFQRAQEILRREVVKRIDLLASDERKEVLAVLARFGYADALVPDQPVLLPVACAADEVPETMAHGRDRSIIDSPPTREGAAA
jgi:hypothetical protein